MAGPVLVEAVRDLTAASTIDWTTDIDATYDRYELICTDMVFSADCELRIRVSQDGGSTWLSTAAGYWYNYTAPVRSASTQAEIRIARLSAGEKFGSAAGEEGATLRVWWSSPNDSTSFKMFRYMAGYTSDSASPWVLWGTGCYKANTTAVDGVRLYPDTGTVTGKFALYGYDRT